MKRNTTKTLEPAKTNICANKNDFWMERKKNALKRIQTKTENTEFSTQKDHNQLGNVIWLILLAILYMAYLGIDNLFPFESR